MATTAPRCLEFMQQGKKDSTGKDDVTNKVRHLAVCVGYSWTAVVLQATKHEERQTYSENGCFWDTIPTSCITQAYSVLARLNTSEDMIPIHYLCVGISSG